MQRLDLRIQGLGLLLHAVELLGAVPWSKRLYKKLVLVDAVQEMMMFIAYEMIKYDI